MIKTIQILFSIIFFFTTPVFSKTSALFQAIIQNNNKLVEYMLQNRVDITAKDKNGMTALHFVSDPYIALNLIKNGADVNAKNNFGSTPLHWSISRNNDIITSLLLEFGADVNSADNNGNTPLHTAINATDSIVLLLLTYNADVNATNKSGSTPTIEALLQNNSSYSKYLLLAGAEDLKNKVGVSPSVLETLESPVFNIATAESPNIDVLIKAIFLENYPQAITLINQNVPIDNTDVDGNTPLHWAFHKKNRYISQLLLQKDAPYDIYNQTDQTPIDILIETRDTNFIQYIQNILKDKTNFSNIKK